MDKRAAFQQWLPVGILAVAGACLYVGLTDKSPGSRTPPSARSAQAQESVNRHLEKTAEKLEMERRRMQVENARMALEYANSAPDPQYAPPTREGAELIHDQRTEKLAEDLGVDSQRTLPTNPMDLIHQQLFEAQRNREMTDAYKKAYAAQFIENARRGGYEIKLNDEFRVISVKPIRRPSSY